MYISALDDIGKYSNTFDVLASQAYMQTLIKNKGSNFEVGDNVRISKQKNIFAKCCVPNSEEVFFD